MDNEKQQWAIADQDSDVAPLEWTFITPCLGASVANDVSSLDLQ
jgi:hypothetical protein